MCHTSGLLPSWRTIVLLALVGCLVHVAKRVVSSSFSAASACNLGAYQKAADIVHEAHSRRVEVRTTDRGKRDLNAIGSGTAIATFRTISQAVGAIRGSANLFATDRTSPHLAFPEH